MKKAGIIIRQEGSYGNLVLTEEVSESDTSSKNSRNNSEGLISLGTKKIKPLDFNVNLFAYYNDLARILASASSNSPTVTNSQESPNKPPVKKEKIGRNDPCPCGSGLKYKKCGLINAKEHRG